MVKARSPQLTPLPSSLSNRSIAVPLLDRKLVTVPSATERSISVAATTPPPEPSVAMVILKSDDALLPTASATASTCPAVTWNVSSASTVPTPVLVMVSV